MTFVVVAVLVTLFLPSTADRTVALAALALSLLLGGLATVLYIRHKDSDRPPHAVNATNLAIAVLGGAVVGVLLFGFQLALEVSDEQRDFRLQMATEHDLTGFSPPRDGDGDPIEGPYSLQGIHLRGKVLALALLNDVDLSASNLQFAHLGSASLVRADLRGARMRVAYLYYADLRCACLADATLPDADLRNADLRGADLRGADLTRADLRGALMDDDTRMDGARTEDACTEPDDTSCGGEARRSQADTADGSISGRPEPEPRGCQPIS
ncbi:MULTISPECIES: pentapeptide repeat-containing protein [unclassified Geodermatophilus]|uniref:pentapeptide repeat-containing protein n=1 Tax=unclassified Geodermatophilus TaxID=2637632 RepID=UPI003EEA7938